MKLNRKSKVQQVSVTDEELDERYKQSLERLKADEDSCGRCGHLRKWHASSLHDWYMAPGCNAIDDPLRRVCPCARFRETPIKVTS